MVGLVVIGAGLAMMTLWPDVAAQNIDRLRDMIGDKPVAQLEEAALNIQDHIQQAKYQMGLVHPESPWADSDLNSGPKQSEPTLSATEGGVTQVAVAPTSDRAGRIVNMPAPQATSRPTSVPTVGATYVPTVESSGQSQGAPEVAKATASPTAIVSAWQLPPLVPLGKLAGEGQWEPYLHSADGQTTVAYRTFLQPDPERPYSIAAIVAFDLQATRLHFVLGTVEPKSSAPQPSRTGAIPRSDLQPGVLLAAFNGGFKARHGHYGAKANGLTALPAIQGLATVAIYTSGQVRIGEWGKDIRESPDLVAWRQNGEPLIHQGKINPDTGKTTLVWGLTLKGQAITWRSGLGISADGRTLYYVAGPRLDVTTLTRAMAQAGAAEALQLDVNNFWVHFAAVHSTGSGLVAVPLLKGMDSEVDRYLKSYSRDFFYVTTATRP